MNELRMKMAAAVLPILVAVSSSDVRLGLKMERMAASDPWSSGAAELYQGKALQTVRVQQNSFGQTLSLVTERPERGSNSQRLAR